MKRAHTPANAVVGKCFVIALVRGDPKTVASNPLRYTPPREIIAFGGMRRLAIGGLRNRGGLE
jgi:hypothetical protein